MTESCPSYFYASISSGIPSLIWFPSSILGSTINKYVGLLNLTWLISQINFPYSMRMKKGVVVLRWHSSFSVENMNNLYKELIRVFEWEMISI